MNRRTLMVAWGLAWAGLWISSVSAAPPVQDRKPYEQQLNKTIAFQIDTPLYKAVQKLGGLAGLRIRLDGETMESAGHTDVKIEEKQISVFNALETVCVESDLRLDWHFIDGEVVIAMRDKIAKSGMVHKVYDARLLLIQPRNYRATDYGLKTNIFDDTAGVCIFADISEPDEEAELTKKGSQLADAIRNHIEPEGWLANGGLSQRISCDKGLLLVYASPQIHKQVAAFLDEYHKTQCKMIALDMRLVAAPRQDVEKLLSQSSTAPVLNAEAADRFVAMLTKQQDKGWGIAQIRQLCTNRQQIAITVGEEKTIVSDLEPVGTNSAMSFDPEIDVLLRGATVQIRPHASQNNQSIYVQLSTMLTAPRLERTAAISTPVGEPVQAIRAGGYINGKIDKETGKLKDAYNNTTGTLQTDPSGGSVASINQPDNEILTFQSDITLPDRGAAVLSCSTELLNKLCPGIQLDNASELVLFIRAKVVEVK